MHPAHNGGGTFDHGINCETFDIPGVSKSRERDGFSLRFPKRGFANLFREAARGLVLGVLSQGVSYDTYAAGLIYWTMHPVLIYQTIC